MPHPIRPETSGIFIAVRDVRTAARWYSALLGVPFQEASLQGPVYSFKLNDGALWLTLDDHSRDPGFRFAPASQALFSLTAGDIEAAYAFVTAHGGQIVHEISSPHPGMHYFNFKDPDGNVLMVVSRED